MSEQQEQPSIKVAFKWLVRNKLDHQRGTWWYIIMGSLGVGLFVYSIYTANFLFAIMIILVVFIVILKDYMPSEDIEFVVTNRGVILGSQAFDYRQLKSFYIIYEPPFTKKLYFEFKNPRPDLSVELNDQDPIEVRSYLLRVLPENLEKEDESTMDILEKALKL